MDVGFLERQKELCLLSSFIETQEEWLKGWISSLGWTVQSLQQEEGWEVRRESNTTPVLSQSHSDLTQTLVQCPFDARHFVPRSSLGDHSKKCQFASALGTDIHKIDLEEFHDLEADQSFLYRNSTAELATIGNMALILPWIFAFFSLLRQAYCGGCEEACHQPSRDWESGKAAWKPCHARAVLQFRGDAPSITVPFQGCITKDQVQTCNWKLKV